MQLDQYPKVSVIVPARNEQERITKCLACLVNQTYPKDKIEILIVDGMSEDKTREIIRDFRPAAGSQAALPIRILDNPNRQRASGLNIGARQAAGDIVVRVDARTVIPEDYIENCVRTLLETGADNVGGIQRPMVEKSTGLGNNSRTQVAIGLAMSHFFGIGNAQFRLGRKSGYVDTVYLGCFRREIFDKVGLFDEDAPVISEDSDMNYRIRKAGGKVYFNKDIVAYYYPRDSIADLAVVKPFGTMLCE